MARNIYQDNNVKMLAKMLAGIQTEKECMAILTDLLTTKEILDISQRLAVAKMLSEKVVYSRIAEETGASTATISRVNRSYQFGAGGYQMALGHIKENKS